MGRIISAGLGKAGLGRICWAGPAQTKEMGRAREKEDAGEDEDGRRGGFRRPRMAVPAARCRNDGTRGHGRRRRALPRLCRARERRRLARIDWDREEFRFFFCEVFEFSGEGFSEFNRRKLGELRRGNRGVLLRGVSRVRSRGKIGMRGKDFERDSRPPSWVSRESEGEREGDIAAEGTCRGSERWCVGRTCRWWQAVAVGRQPRRVGDGRGTQ
ncbi:hypothetical protein CRG98_048082 [Punica granatum]|uniref:Uncharacterized protein n=1 Tax=Punica granatum TaxID=22663 RepID=A0A2I0HII6_PUNGR|nr:hypothetical protein CRG98_048082 [Punica granatum]